MTGQIVPIASPSLPALIVAAGEKVGMRFLEFFAANIRNSHTRRAYERAAAAGIATKVGNHSFRATGITAYLKNGGTLEKAAQMANHASTRTTQLYDRRRDELSLDEVERIRV